MKKIKLLLVAIILLAGCTNTKVENENQNLAQNLEVSEQTQIDSPSDILKNLLMLKESLIAVIKLYNRAPDIRQSKKGFPLLLRIPLCCDGLRPTRCIFSEIHVIRYRV